MDYSATGSSRTPGRRAGTSRDAPKASTPATLENANAAV